MDTSKIHHVSKNDMNNWNSKATIEDLGEYLSSEAGAITADKIAEGAVTGDKIADNTIVGSKLVNNTITRAELANNSVGTNQINNLAVSTDKIASNAVTATQLANVGVLDRQVAIGSAAQATGGRSTALGNGAHATDTNATALGEWARATHANATALGGTTNSTTTLQVLLGRTSATPMAHRALSVISDQRDKAEITPLKYDALEFINKVEPKQYKLDFRSDYTRHEEISEAEYEQLDAYTKHHRVRNIPVYSINNEIEFIEYSFDEDDIEETNSKKRNNINQDQFKTIIKSNVLRSRKEAIEKYKSNHIAKKNLQSDTEGIQEATEEIIEQNITKVRDMKLLRKFLPKDGSKINNRYHNGVLAQQVKKVADEMGFDFCGFKDHTVNGGDDLYSITYEEFIAPMIGAIQQLTKKLQIQEIKIEELENKLNNQ